MGNSLFLIFIEAVLNAIDATKPFKLQPNNFILIRVKFTRNWVSSRRINFPLSYFFPCEFSITAKRGKLVFPSCKKFKEIGDMISMNFFEFCLPNQTRIFYFSCVWKPKRHWGFSKQKVGFSLQNTIKIPLNFIEIYFPDISIKPNKKTGEFLEEL